MQLTVYPMITGLLLDIGVCVWDHAGINGGTGCLLVRTAAREGGLR